MLKRPGIAILAVLIVAAIAILAFCAFPWGILRATAQDRLSADLKRSVTIASMERVDSFSLHPTIALRGIRIGQPSWAGSGDLAKIGEARVTFPVLDLLTGNFRPEAIDVRGMRIDLVRRADGSENWRDDPAGGGGGETERPIIHHLTVVDSVISYRDARSARSFTAQLAASDSGGVTLAGTGFVHSVPVRLNAHGGAIDAISAPWPFRAEVEGSNVGMTLVGRMDRPLDMGHFTADATGHATDLKLLDAIIEAGLPASQPVKLSATLRHDGQDWGVSDLKGMIGRSDIAGRATIGKKDGRHLIDAELSARRFDFDDLSSNQGRKIASAKQASLGKRLIPDTAIDLQHMLHTDGSLKIDVAELLWPGSSPFRGLAGTIRVDHGLMTIAPLILTLSHGRMSGKVIVDQRRGGPVLTVGLDVVGGRLLDFVPDGKVDGALRGHIRLTGQGRTVRSAIGRSSGNVAIVARDGEIPARTASLLGQDIGRGLFGRKDKQATLRCLIARLDVNGGIARPAPMLIDTSRALSQIEGSINLADERMALDLRGTPKIDSRLRIDGAVPIRGTIKDPDIGLPAQARSIKGILKAIGRALDGDDQPISEDLDCDAETARALR